MNLSPQEEQHWRQRLREEEQRLSERFQTEERLIRDEFQREENPGDGPALATREGNKDILLNLQEGQRREFQAIADAWQRLDEGTFGMCANCKDQRIPRERLEAVPYATTCIQCSEEAH